MNEIFGQDEFAEKNTVLKFKKYPKDSSTCSLCIKHLRAKFFDAILNTYQFKIKADPFFKSMIHENLAFVGHSYWYLFKH